MTPHLLRVVRLAAPAWGDGNERLAGEQVSLLGGKRVWLEFVSDAGDLHDRHIEGINSERDSISMGVFNDWWVGGWVGHVVGLLHIWGPGSSRVGA